MKTFCHPGVITLSFLVGACGGHASSEPAQPQSPVAAVVPASRGGQDLISKQAPQWGDVQWLQGGPLSLDALRGKVVLIRFWTDTCPFCRASAPALVELDERYRGRGLQVVGMYHPKPRGTQRPAEAVREVVAEFGWSFPIAIDEDWSTLQTYWLDHHKGGEERGYTSVSFILDRTGAIRFVHPGPEFRNSGDGQPRRDFDDVVDAIEALLSEPA